MKKSLFRNIVGVLLLGSIPLRAADNTPIIPVAWTSRTAACPAKVTQSTAVIFRVTGINDLIIDFNTGDSFSYQFRAKGTAVSAVPAENLFLKTQAPPAACPVTEAQFLSQLAAIRTMAKDDRITPPIGSRSVPLDVTINAARSHQEIVVVANEFGMAGCKQLFQDHRNDLVVQWINRLIPDPNRDPQLPPVHSVDIGANLEPDKNYDYTLQEVWLGKKVQGGTLNWSCGESDLFSLSVGPLITTLPYRTYSHQKAPVPPGSSNTQDILVVSGTTNVNTLGAALLNLHLPRASFLPAWTGLALSVGPVYTLGDAPSVSRLGLFAGGSVHLYRSFYLTPGVHIGEFADFPAGFTAGSVIPNQFGDLNPVKRNTVHFAIGITYKTNSFKKSSQSAPTANSTTPVGAPQGNKTPGNSGNSGSPGTGSTPSTAPQGQSPGVQPQPNPNAPNPPND